MKKLVTFFLATVMILTLCVAFSACSSKKDTYEIALITDKGNIDDKSFNQGSWEGVVAFAKEKNISHKYYKPEEASDAGYLASIDLAVKNGAKVVVTPGYLFEVAVFEAQTKYPDVKFIILDAVPRKDVVEIKSNVASIMYSEEQSGFLAGYAVVIDGYRKLGFMGGMAVPAVQAFGYGFLQGAEAAAAELNLGDGAISVTYHYTGNFDATDTNKATAKTMYQEGTEVIFACGGSVGKSVIAAAEEAGKKVIGVDVDQSKDSATVITSATKGLSASVQAVLKSIYVDNKFDQYAGKTTYFSAKNAGVALPAETSKFTNFNKAKYDAIFAKLVDDSIKVTRTFTVVNASGYATAEELKTNLKLVKVTVTARQ